MLTDKQCKNASCDAGRPRVRLADSGGLYLEVSPSGSKRWFWKYRFDGKEKRLALGGYPDLGLKEARVARDDARKQHQSGADPVLTRQVERLSSRFDANASFELTAREFHATKCWLPRSFTNHRTVLASLCDRVMCTGGGAMRNGIGFGLGLLI
jgi:Arm DNA-binding domain